jgi:hypothetical protein
MSRPIRQYSATSSRFALSSARCRALEALLELGEHDISIWRKHDI